LVNDRITTLSPNIMSISTNAAPQAFALQSGKGEIEKMKIYIGSEAMGFVIP